MRIAALIPAKKKSVRLKNKNFMLFKGIPIIEHTIKEAKKTKLFSEIAVSTDNKKIQNRLKTLNVKFHLRKKKLCNTKATLVEVIEEYLKNSKNKIDILCVLLATAPLRNFKDIKSVIKLLNKKNCNFSLAATSYNLPPHQALKLKKNNFVYPLFKKIINEREDKFGKLVVDNGSTYAFFVKDFLKQKNFFGKKLKVYVMPKKKSFDLNDKEDLDIIKAL